jgi:hypothetical protein
MLQRTKPVWGTAMRVGSQLAFSICLAVMITSASFAYDAPAAHTVAEGVVLPVILKQKIDTAKIKPGEVVKFELLSPVIANHEVVIPANAKVFGRVVEAHPLANNPFSSLAVVIESIVWKRQTVPLHAHLAGFGKLKVTYFGKKYSCDQNLSDVFRSPTRPAVSRNEPSRQATNSAPRSVFSETQCDSVAATSETDSQNVAHIRLYRTTSQLVPVAFGSTKRDIVLKKGTLLVIRNGAEPVSVRATSAKNKMPRQ